MYKYVYYNNFNSNSFENAKKYFIFPIKLIFKNNIYFFYII